MPDGKESIEGEGETPESEPIKDKFDDTAERNEIGNELKGVHDALRSDLGENETTDIGKKPSNATTKNGINQAKEDELCDATTCFSSAEKENDLCFKKVKGRASEMPKSNKKSPDTSGYGDITNIDGRDHG